MRGCSRCDASVRRRVRRVGRPRPRGALGRSIDCQRARTPPPTALGRDRWRRRDRGVRHDCAAVDAQIQFTRAVTVDVPPEGVWPWLAQIGQDRGGFYSYAFLENLAGCRLHNAARIHAEWQHREIGEELPLHWAHGMRIAAFEPGRMLAIDGWGAFVIEPRDGSRTSRLLARARMRRGTASVFYALVVEIPHFVMERKMLLGIRQRAENSAKPLGHRRDRSLRRHVRVT
jgi:hypothetical protein